MPSAALRGKIGGIYLRPRFLAGRGFSPNAWLKSIGWSRLLRTGWFTHLLLLDPYLAADVKSQNRSTPVYFLPDPYPDEFAADRASARRAFVVPGHQRVFLFYGGAYRRKGLPLVVKAMGSLPGDVPAFLLCAGQQADDPEVQRGLDNLIRQGRARVLSRYVSAEEEKLLFAAADVVLLPYLGHFGSSGVLSRAAGAGRPVIASDEELVGRLVREHGLGPVFPSGDVEALRGRIGQLAKAREPEIAEWQAAARAYAPQCSRAAFREALLEAFDHAVRSSR
jgi:glycosyltransferase involved in cell wall biosynthesis